MRLLLRLSASGGQTALAQCAMGVRFAGACLASSLGEDWALPLGDARVLLNYTLLIFVGPD